jgi:large subunit ribosomal protein L13
MKTFTLSGKDIVNEWYVLDAADENLGRITTRIATVLRGKHKPTYQPNLDCGDNVIVINAEKLASNPRKDENKLYHFHSGFPGGLKTLTYGELTKKFPERVVELAVKGMIPQGPLGRQVRGRLYVYAGENHPHAAQTPKPFPEHVKN